MKDIAINEAIYVIRWASFNWEFLTDHVRIDDGTFVEQFVKRQAVKDAAEILRDEVDYSSSAYEMLLHLSLGHWGNVYPELLRCIKQDVVKHTTQKKSERSDFDLRRKEFLAYQESVLLKTHKLYRCNTCNLERYINLERESIYDIRCAKCGQNNFIEWPPTTNTR